MVTTDEHDGKEYQRLVERFLALSYKLYDTPGFEETCTVLLHMAREVIGSRHAGLLVHIRSNRQVGLELMDPGDDLVKQVQLDELQLGEGPGWTADSGEEFVLVPDVASDSPWPSWAAKATELGIGSALALRLPRPQDPDRPRPWGPLGVLEFFHPEPNAFGQRAREAAPLLIGHASVALAASRHEESMAQAVDARKLIGMAMGRLIERYGIDGDAAFQILKKYSQDNNIKLRTVAAMVVTGEPPFAPTPTVK
ncbi:ANTAR domain-containing protein [Kribbella capetownensis]|uniref:ANTAR domain-containing protein n=1 Tax=Kribbella capetownensis TaxID=1572659 RepID=A0A4R0IN98_9ACTN|nr:GAF and ANTAR domain-containing protein [Kribbella capetownensis]TCC33900.1 ANTAR domain-containing protein [Kribbella capetownensis]